MKIETVLFDLDGVLCDSPDMHYETFTKSYYKYTGISISKKEHDIDFNGKSTRTKLNTLKERDGFTDLLFDLIWAEKQDLTFDYIDKNFSKDEEKIELLTYLKEKEYLVACASNAIKETILRILNKLEITKFFDLVLSNSYPP